MNEITVVMPAYREKPSQIRKAVESILNQTYSNYKYIIILDDPSNNELNEILSIYASKDSRITYIINDYNIGCPSTKNKGIQLAQTEYIAIMDADDIAEPRRLEYQLEHIKATKADLIGGFVSVIDENDNILYNMDNLPTIHSDIIKKLNVNNCIPHPTWFLSRKMYMAIGGYNNIQGCEDYDLLLRARANGYTFSITPRIVLKYRLSTSSISRNSLYKQYLMFLYINDKYTKRKYKELSPDEFITKHYTQNKASRFSKASILVEKALDAKRSKAYGKMLIRLIKAGFTSFEYDKKILRYIFQNN